MKGVYIRCQKRLLSTAVEIVVETLSRDLFIDIFPAQKTILVHHKQAIRAVAKKYVN